MKRAVCCLVVVSIALGLCVESCVNSPTKKRKQLAKRFVACVPDSLGDDHRREIVQLLDTFWARADMGEVYMEDVQEIDARLQHYADAGRITGEQLLHLMAKVGYYTYRKDPRYNLPDGVVDHPTLNPDAALIQFGADSSGGYRMYYRKPSADTTKAPSQEGRQEN